MGRATPPHPRIYQGPPPPHKGSVKLLMKETFKPPFYVRGQPGQRREDPGSQVVLGTVFQKVFKLLHN